MKIKRLKARVIDMFLGILIINVILFIILIGPAIYQNDIFMLFELQNLYMIGAVLLFGVYFWVIDYVFQGISVGNKILHIQVRDSAEGRVDFRFAIKHSIMKMVASVTWPISILYQLIFDKMYYDKWLEIKVKSIAV